METSSSIYHITAITLLAEGPKRTSVSVTGSLADIAELVKLWGGRLHLSIKETSSMLSVQGSFKNCDFWGHYHTSVEAGQLQRDALKDQMPILAAGTNMTILDDKYLIVSDAS